MVSAQVILMGKWDFFSYLLSWDFTPCLGVMKDLLCLCYDSISASLAGVNNQSMTYSCCVLGVSGQLQQQHFSFLLDLARRTAA